MTRFAFALLALFAIGACSAVPGLEKDATPGQRLLGAEVQYNTVFALMAEYEGLQRCNPSMTTKVCSQQAVVDRMRSAHVGIVKAMDTAWTVIRSSGANATTKDYAVNTVEALIADAKTLYDSVKDVIVGKRST